MKDKLKNKNKTWDMSLALIGSIISTLIAATAFIRIFIPFILSIFTTDINVAKSYLSSIISNLHFYNYTSQNIVSVESALMYVSIMLIVYALIIGSTIGSIVMVLNIYKNKQKYNVTLIILSCLTVFLANIFPSSYVTNVLILFQIIILIVAIIKFVKCQNSKIINYDNYNYNKNAYDNYNDNGSYANYNNPYNNYNSCENQNSNPTDNNQYKNTNDNVNSFN